MSKIVQVKLGERTYPIWIGRESAPLPDGLGAPGSRILIVSDTNVDPLYGALWQARLEQAGFVVSRAVVPAGEKSKDMATTALLYHQALTAGLDRGATIMALGGGVVGDLAGYVAATFLRGIRLVQAPTSLLAMVDSSVGGKTGINLPEGKNLVGAFHQPVAVIADLATLLTLPKREYLSGLAEVVKYGVIWDAVLFHKLENHVAELQAGDPELLEAVVARCCAIKADVVALDERESGPRAVLNFGHTLAHAIETTVGYGTWLHGEAVAMGMVYAARLSARVLGLPEVDAGRVTRLLEQLGLPARFPDGDWAALRAVMIADKKSVRQMPRFVLVKKLGEAEIGCEVPDPVLEEIWNVVC
ncbi:MAG: 3-dehydroquinate synthase [bacterium]